MFLCKCATERVCIVLLYLVCIVRKTYTLILWRLVIKEVVSLQTIVKLRNTELYVTLKPAINQLKQWVIERKHTERFFFKFAATCDLLTFISEDNLNPDTLNSHRLKYTQFSLLF